MLRTVHTNSLNNPDHWRKRAEEARRIAEGMNDDKLAERAEERDCVG
jgi:hypothetical protein